MYPFPWALIHHPEKPAGITPWLKRTLLLHNLCSTGKALPSPCFIVLQKQQRGNLLQEWLKSGEFPVVLQVPYALVVALSWKSSVVCVGHHQGPVFLLAHCLDSFIVRLQLPVWSVRWLRHSGGIEGVFKVLHTCIEAAANGRGPLRCNFLNAGVRRIQCLDGLSWLTHRWVHGWDLGKGDTCWVWSMAWSLCTSLYPCTTRMLVFKKRQDLLIKRYPF